MNGIEILSQETVYETTLSLLPFFIAIGVGAVIGFIICGNSISCIFGFDLVDGVFGALLGAIVGIFVGLLLSAMTIHPTNEIDYIKYKVTIDDSVSMNEFLEKYEILDQEGKIYTIKEKE